jgi:hypothetical protein
MINCKKCSFENSPDNITCANCDTKMLRKRVPRKPKAIAPHRRSANYCEKCGSYKSYPSFMFGGMPIAAI